MIQEFSIENTLSIKERQTISFEPVQEKNEDALHYIDVGNTRLLKLAAIYGSNASGKTNVLNAVNFYINFILNAFTDLKPQEGTNFIPFAFDTYTKNSPGTFELVFFVDEIKHEYFLSLDRKRVYEEKLFYSPKGQKKLIYQRIYNSTNKNSEGPSYEWKWGDNLLGSKTKIADMTRANTSFLNTAAQLKHPFLGKIYKFIALSFLPMITPATRGLLDYTISKIENDESMRIKILGLLQKADFGNIDDIKIETKEIPPNVLDSLPDEIKEDFKNIEGKFEIKDLLVSHQYGEHYFLPISRESAGTQRLLQLGGPLFALMEGEHFICIDEIESSLHQELLEFFFKTFLENSTKSQILFTTHNLDLLDSEFLLDDEIWFCEKDNEGGSNCTSFAEYKGVRKESSRKKLYNAGRFGAKPIISALILD